MDSTNKLPTIIQGGMGIAVSNWVLANAVSRRDQMGVVSGTGIDSVLARRLQLGDPGGHMRRAMEYFPWPEMARRVLDAYFIPGGKPADAPFKLNPMKKMKLGRRSVELLIVSNFVEVWLAREDHEGVVGINYLEKIQRPTLPSMLGAMLGGVDFVLMGAGIPLAIPGILDKIAQWDVAELRLAAADNPNRHSYVQTFDPRQYAEGELFPLKRPKFLAIISSEILAQTFVRRASGYTDGFIVEYHTAGGHNAPPRKDRDFPDRVNQYGPKDEPDVAAIAAIGRPFWMAGGYATPERIRWALDNGAAGVQLGSIFATADESGLVPEIRQEIIDRYLSGDLTVRTDFIASPTGFPFKVVDVDGTVGLNDVYEERDRICDMGYLREMYSIDENKVGYRCASEPISDFVDKGGTEDGAAGRRCLCNGLMATIGLGQVRENGIAEPAVVTGGDDFSFLDHLLKDGATSYNANDVLDYLLCSSKSETVAVAVPEQLVQ
ncbi:MAG: nitronate monooxygenase [Pirellulaceae bacterium]